MQEAAPPTGVRDVVVIGGGCYGSFYAGQLAAARAKGKVAFRSVILVDRDPACRAAGTLGDDFRLEVADWGAFLDGFLDRDPPPAGTPDDAIVPSPLMPHLMAEWLTRTAERLAPGRVAAGPAFWPMDTPFDRLAPDGNRYVSHADWLCPTHCIEPHLCPVTRAPRTWEMSETLAEYVRAAPAAAGRVLGPALFVTRHRAFGVGMFDLPEVRLARALLAAGLAEEEPATLVVGTISACHGAVGTLRLGRGCGS
ncbi:MAG: hypothetical protein AB7L66_16475 [Gemmatimonadales bacterium]